MSSYRCTPTLNMSGHGWTMGGPWADHGLTMGWPWADHGLTMGGPWVDHWLTMWAPVAVCEVRQRVVWSWSQSSIGYNFLPSNFCLRWTWALIISSWDLRFLCTSISVSWKQQDKVIIIARYYNKAKICIHVAPNPSGQKPMLHGAYNPFKHNVIIRTNTFLYIEVIRKMGYSEKSTTKTISALTDTH